MNWTTYLTWAKLDVAHYGTLSLFDRLTVFRDTVGTSLAVLYGRPLRKRIRQRLPAWTLLRRLELVGRRADGLAWFRAPDSHAARHLADVQPDGNREGHAVLREGEMLLLDSRGHIRGLVISDDNESIIELHDGQGWISDIDLDTLDPSMARLLRDIEEREKQAAIRTTRS